VTAVQVRPDAASISNLKVMRLLCWTYLYDFDGEFVTEYSGIGEKRLISLEGMEISATYADVTNSNLNLIAGRWWRERCIFKGEFARFYKHD
jgi:hypothetical protein